MAFIIHFEPFGCSVYSRATFFFGRAVFKLSKNSKQILIKDSYLGNTLSHTLFPKGNTT